MPSYDVIIYVKYFIMWHFKSIVDLIYGIINSLNTDEKMSVEGADNDGNVERANGGKL